MNKIIKLILIIAVILISNSISFFAGIQSGSSIWRNDLIQLGNQISNINHKSQKYSQNELPILAAPNKNSITVYMGFIKDTEVTINFDDEGKVTNIIHNK